MSPVLSTEQTFVALSGGVGGAKLALGLSRVLPPGRLSIVTNTADDFVHLGLHISPDLDTVTYTLAGLANQETGWGRQAECWNFMSAMSELGGETWFRLGDKDLALHVERTRRLASGLSLTQVTRDIAQKFGIEQHILPMSDDLVRTIVATPDGELPFQHYFVRDQCEATVNGFRFDGIAQATPTCAVLDALADPLLQGIVLCPSNPFVSIDPILAVPGLKQAIRARGVPVIAISPIIGGAALKGPAAKMMRDLGMPSTSEAIAQYYSGFIDGLIIDEMDKDITGKIANSGLRVKAMNTVMRSLEDRLDLARAAIDFCHELGLSTNRRAS